ncbi:uncharacterized protein BP01DRAFT_265973, partial [Aspergillus saccharolyticus JOP 1030-1]
LKLYKIFIGFLSIQLLDQRVDSLELTISVDKLTAIYSLKFLKILVTLEYYLGL